MVFQIAPERKVHGHLLVSVHVLAGADVGGLLVLLLQQAQSRHGTNSKQLVLWWAIQLLYTSCKPPQSTVLPHSGETVSLLSLLLHIHTRPGLMTQVFMLFLTFFIPILLIPPPKPFFNPSILSCWHLQITASLF